jgi:hypothetical protein
LIPKKPNKQENLTRQDMERAHAIRHSGFTVYQLGEAMLETVRQMSPQEKEELRKHLDQQFKIKLRPVMPQDRRSQPPMTQTTWGFRRSH